MEDGHQMLEIGPLPAAHPTVRAKARLDLLETVDVLLFFGGMVLVL
ncbi:hypothetical protein ACFU5Y_00685 [Streptomyces gardneri]